MSSTVMMIVVVAIIVILAIVLIAAMRGRNRLRPLPSESRMRYANSWRDIEARFVDSPQQAVSEADRLVLAAFQERGGREDHLPGDIQKARSLVHSESGDSMTENLRRAMQHYRSAVADLIGSDPREAPTRGREVAS